MDILVTTGFPTAPLALDVTIVNPSRPSAAPQASLIDTTAANKNRKYALPCSQVNWRFTPIVFDTYGACSPVTRALTKKLIKKIQSGAPVEDRPFVGAQVWQTLTTAAITRCATQLGEVTQADNPAGIPMNVLQWTTQALKRARAVFSTPPVGSYTGNSSMGANPTQPSMSPTADLIHSNPPTHASSRSNMNVDTHIPFNGTPGDPAESEGGMQC